MNDRNEFEENREIDLVDFSANSEMQRIRENERIEREKRRKRAAEIRRREIIKQKKRQRLQQMIIAWGIVVLVLLAIVAAIIGIVSIFTGGDEEDKTVEGGYVSEEETTLVSEFSANKEPVYVKRFGSEYLKLAKDIVIKASSNENQVKSNGELWMYTNAYIWNSGFGEIDDVKALVLDTPMLNNGYVWTENEGMKSSLSQSYHYDTHASFIKAVSEICLWEGDTSFLGEIDPKSVTNKDISAGKSVKQKLDKAVEYLFDTSDPYGGGIRYNDEDGLVYISTLGNDGTPEGKASNIFFTYKFGYLDCYNNLLFNDAMISLSRLYKLAGDEENSKKYQEIAEKNKDAINKTFYDSQKGRYIGCIDSDGEKHDNGFTVINLMAVSLGVADGTKAEKIMAWANEEARVSNGIFPAFSTVEANDTVWDTIGGKYLTSAEENFGNFWLNGARSAVSGYCYLGASKTLGEKNLNDYISKITRGIDNGSLKLPDENNPAVEPSLYYALLSSKAVKEAFGVETDGKVLTLDPLFGLGETVGIKNIAFSGKNYDFLFNNETVYILSDVNGSVRIRIGGYDKNTKLSLTVVDDGKIVSNEQVKTDKSGNIVISKKFGETSYVKLEPVKEKK